MTANEDDNPHYDDLIRELRELKKFIESNGDNVVTSQTPARIDDEDDDSSAPSAPPPQAASAAASRPPADDDAGGDDDGPPTLREAVRRAPRRDEMQLDLLSVSRHEAEPADDHEEPDEETSAPAPSPGDSSPAQRTVAPSTSRDEEGDSAQPADRNGAASQQSPPHALPGGDHGDDESFDEAADDEVIRFVLDLSDRILGTIEDRLLEHSGELLPEEVRTELRGAIGDILYEWCER